VDFVLALHSHLPWVLHHGRWPHGSDWLCEAALDTYLPLLEQLRRLERAAVPAPVSIGFTPVLANQLSHPSFAAELEAYVAHRLQATEEAPASLVASGDEALLPLADFWRSRLRRLQALYDAVDRDLVGAFRRLCDAGRIEIMGSAATHGYLPLLARDESVRLQLFLGRAEHRRLFGADPAGCWLPECAYRPRGRWEPLPGERAARVRRGIEEHLAATGFRYFFTDAHLAHAGAALGIYADVPLGTERFDAERHDPPRAAQDGVAHSPYHAYRVAAQRDGRAVAALVRDPRSSLQVWSRQHGYPGDEWYLEFHKIRWPEGLKLWRVTGSGVDLGDKLPYEPHRATQRAEAHAEHFASVLAGIAAEQREARGVVVAPFDTELFGHWWFEGLDFLGALYARLAAQRQVRAATASQHLGDHAPRQTLRLAPGSWGAGGDNGMWLNDQTAWTWRRLWKLEDAFWEVAPKALAAGPAWRVVLAQAARELLLAQSSDWQFIISTGVAGDYAERRFLEHCEAAERLAVMLTAVGEGEALGSAAAWMATELAERDDLFPDVLPAVEYALADQERVLPNSA
jgi:1,4-alpha-glucan branching enzyme